jgi:hypothetical protein
MSYVSLTELFPSSFLTEASFQQSLGEEFQLCDNGNMIFHWADFADTCDMVREMLQRHADAGDDFKKRELALTRMAQIPVWIRTNRSAHQTTMFDLYERYILNQTRLSMGVDPFGPIEISFISSTGPFRELALVECFNKTTYRDFVMVYLLRGKLPKRDFRVRLKAKVLMEYGADFNDAYLINLEQLTSNGLLLSMDSDFFLHHISKQSAVRILLDSSMLAEGIGKSLTDLKTHLSQYAFNLLYSSRKEDAIHIQLADFSVQSSFDFLKNKKVFLFISYKQIGGNQVVLDNIQRFVGHSKGLIRNHFAAAMARSA